MIWKKLMFQYLFYTGSWVNKEKYGPFINDLQKQTGIEKLEYHNIFDNKLSKMDKSEAILVGHSLGGYFALRDAKKYADKVAGVVLINSHYNSRGVMPYCRTNPDDVYPPVLMIMADNDEKLPVGKALDDFWDSIQYMDLDKYFIVNKNMSHFSGLTTEIEKKDNIINPIKVFTECLKTRNFTGMRILEEPLRNRFKPYIDDLTKYSIITSKSTNVLDAILQIAIPRWLWRSYHYMWFLTCKPEEYIHFIYEDDDHIMWKGSFSDEKHMGKVVSKWIDNYGFLDFRLPTIHLSILVWLLFPLFVFRINDEYNSVIIPRFILKVNNNTTYYKIPHYRRIYPLLNSTELLKNL